MFWNVLAVIQRGLRKSCECRWINELPENLRRADNTEMEKRDPRHGRAQL